MKVVIACGAMSFGPSTPIYKSLGGSETAALMAAKEIAKRGHDVSLYCNLPAPGAPDHIASGTKHTDDVTYINLSEYQKLVGAAEKHDVTIVVRDPGIAAVPVNSRKKVLWMHDIATKRGMQRAFDEMAWTIDEVWTVSEWHRQQVHEATGYPLEFIHAMRNGIVPTETLPAPRSNKQIIYAARPERGIDNLIRPGGVMENLPEYNLVVAMYDHFPEHMRDYYEAIFKRMSEMPNVEFVGPKPQSELRQMIRDSAAYIYPTQFEETSCILAREAIEQGTPFLTTRVGALPETLGDAGVFFEDWLAHTEPYAGTDEAIPPAGSPEWCKLFATFFRDRVTDDAWMYNVAGKMEARKDLYWDGVAEMMEKRFAPKPFKGGEKPSVIACVIAQNNETTILKMLKSIEKEVDHVNVALGPSSDNTQQIIEEWSLFSGVKVTIIDVPKIEPWKFGFDDARKASLKDYEKYDFFIWIDTDEFLTGSFKQYLRNNMLQGYIIPQHHFTVEPRGAPLQIDRPARLLRTDAGYEVRGHIHEHFEIGDAAVGRVWMLPDVDLGHVGYENENTRRGRFDRNFPFLEWDHSTEKGRERKLHHFLWFRDLVHMMRMAIRDKKMDDARRLANEALTYYNEHREDMNSFGQGLQMSLAYISEVYHAMGTGMGVRVTVGVEDIPPFPIEGRFENYEHFEKTMRHVLAPAFADRTHKYW